MIQTDTVGKFMSKRLSKNNPARQKRDFEVLALRLLGNSLREIGQEMGLCHTTRKMILDQDDIKPILDKHMKDIRKNLQMQSSTLLTPTWTNRLGHGRLTPPSCGKNSIDDIRE